DGVHDLRAGRAYGLVDGVDVLDLDAEVRVHRCRRVLGDEDDLGGGVGRRDQVDDPAEVHLLAEAEELVEGAARGRVGGRDVGYGTTNGHAPDANTHPALDHVKEL